MKPGEKLLLHLDEIKKLAAQCHIRELRVFGSVARREDREDSDVDLLAYYEDGATILDHAAFTRRIKETLQTDCDILTDEILDKKGFHNLSSISVTLDEFAAGKTALSGAASRQERNASFEENIQWIFRRIASTVENLSFEEFCADPARYDALSWQFQLLTAILHNAEEEQIEQLSQQTEVDLSVCAELPDILLTTVYPRMLYQTAKKLESRRGTDLV